MIGDIHSINSRVLFFVTLRINHTHSTALPEPLPLTWKRL